MTPSAPLPNLRVQASSVLDVAEQRLREAILLGQLPPGQHLAEGNLATKMGISRPSLREALRRLEAQQLVRLIPNKGSFVAELREEDIGEIRDVWRLLTGEAVFRYAERATDEGLAEMRLRVREMSASMRKGDVLGLLRATNGYFAVVLKGSANVTLANFIRIIVSRINFLRAQSLSDPAHRKAHVKQLQEVLDLLAARDAHGARRATEAHIDLACDGALEISRDALVA